MYPQVHTHRRAHAEIMTERKTDSRELAKVTIMILSLSSKTLLQDHPFRDVSGAYLRGVTCECCSKTPPKSRRLLFVDLPDVWRPWNPGRRREFRLAKKTNTREGGSGKDVIKCIQERRWGIPGAKVLA